jgi:hypothetical protein
MFGFFSAEKKREKKVEWAVAICHEYSDTCIEVICKVTSALRATKAQEKQGGEIKDYIENVGRFDPEVAELFGSDDSIHFWYTFGTQLAEEEELGNEIGLVLAIRTLMEFMSLNSDGVTDLGEKRHEEGHEKLQKGKRDRIVKIECAAILAAQSISRIRGMTDVACEIYQYYVCRFPQFNQAVLDKKIKKYDLLIKENFL